MVSPAMYCVTGVARWDVLNLRAYPSATSRILVGIPPNRCGIAFLPFAVGDWQKIRVDGWEGWAHRSYLSGQCPAVRLPRHLVRLTWGRPPQDQEMTPCPHPPGAPPLPGPERIQPFVPAVA
jgi:hypothetical protein